jgi:hypothetical protein
MGRNKWNGGNWDEACEKGNPNIPHGKADWATGDYKAGSTGSWRKIPISNNVGGVN